MRKFLILFLFAGLFACNENKNTTPEVEPIYSAEEETERMFTRDDVEPEQDVVVTDETTGNLLTRGDAEIVGTYQLVDADTEDCACNCLELSFTNPTELCVQPDEIYIHARYARAGDNKINVYLEGPATVQNSQRELPWEEFDTSTPIATLSMQPNGTLVLEWEGFAIDGEVATDYALYGKKTLEGTYEKQE